MLAKKIECRPVWKPMHKQPVYAGATAYTNDVETALFKIAAGVRRGRLHAGCLTCSARY